MTLMKYDVFWNKEERSEVYEFSKAIADYIHQNNVKTLILVDRSARPAYVGIMEFWTIKYPNEKMPGIYFMNPQGFRGRDTDEILNELQEIYGSLIENRREPTLIFDTCIHTGRTLSPLKNILESMGFSDLKIGSINPADDESLVESDFYITNERPEGGCYPFEKDRLVLKCIDSVISKMNDDREDVERGHKSRKEIKQIIKSHAKSMIWYRFLK